MGQEERSGLHSTTVQLRGKGVIIMGVSGAGKTELALTLIERAQLRGQQAIMVADDRTLVEARDGHLWAHVPPTLAGGVEIRGAGLFRIAHTESARLDLMVQLVGSARAERFPSGQKWHHDGLSLPQLFLPALRDNGDSNALSRAIEATLFLENWPG